MGPSLGCVHNMFYNFQDCDDSRSMFIVYSQAAIAENDNIGVN